MFVVKGVDDRMQTPSVRPTDEVETVVHTYGNMLLLICFVMLGNKNDAEDAVQEGK